MGMFTVRKGISICTESRAATAAFNIIPIFYIMPIMRSIVSPDSTPGIDPIRVTNPSVTRFRYG